ncbi:S-adenosyl-L-methionine-dependent methyltransferase [Dunaliella salina]|uniref:S-adenosyl-L-methionine-dependent methyltransferase n=1 Tax=Dunaliella salina TaxID=3046 RepID=A0ABQ7FVL7_DUNSA|nr:S-adenosyl-L-methionine-dependent methyltransferase [Dunaliella salina]|eukprot:KAF5826430.1 S-adenosyl-L-methionine-dependent methyltransferase [Dunaliella salina]
MHLMAHGTSLPGKGVPLAKPRVAKHHCNVRTRVATPEASPATNNNTPASPPEQQPKPDAPFQLACPIWFARSGKFAGVIASDFSESMLQQACNFFQEDGTLSRTLSDSPSSGAPPVLLLRADVGRLPFPTGSVAAIHSGAAIHCWPNPQAAMAEISRVLAPGGIFVASTFLVPSAPLGQVLGDDVVRPLNQLDAPFISGQYRWWEEAELRDLCTGVGLQDFVRDRSMRFIMFSAKKPV